MGKPKKKETLREKMKRYYLKRKAAAKKPGPKPPPAVKIEGDMNEAFTRFLNYRPKK